MDLKELELGIDPNKHWYYQSKLIPLVNYYKQIQQNGINQLIDIGAGSGFFSNALFERNTDKITNVQWIDTGYSELEMKESAASIINKHHSIEEHVSNSLLIMMDVLEHIEDDANFLKSIKEKCDINNHFFVTVPAFKSIWSGHDEYLDHFRRYTISSLRNVLESQSFQVDKIYYIYGSLFPAVWLKRKLLFKNNTQPKSDMQVLPNFINSFLKNYSGLEMKVSKLNSFFGLTCVAEGRIL